MYLHTQKVSTAGGFKCTCLTNGRLLEDDECNLFVNSVPIKDCRVFRMICEGLPKEAARSLAVKGE